MKPLIERVKEYVSSKPDVPHFPPASTQSIAEAESRLGFPIPDTLKACYLHIGNGGLYTSGLGLIGLEGGFQSDAGSLVEIYDLFYRDGIQQLGIKWPKGLLPFWQWGCNMWSCVDCTVPHLPVSTLEEGRIYRQSYSLDQFFELLLIRAAPERRGHSQLRRCRTRRSRNQ